MDVANITLGNLELTRIFFALVLLLAAAHGVGYFFKRLLKAPKVIGEILGGLLLGPTVLGFFFPEAYTWTFNAFPGEGQIISLIYWIGLVLLMFISGFEIQKSVSGDDKRIITTLLLGATTVPFLIGWFAPNFFDFTPYLGTKGNMLAFTIVLAIAIAVTSIPVISKIFIDLGAIGTRFAKIVIATATVEDVILWVALAVATGLVGGAVFSVSSIIVNVGIILAFFAAALLLFPKVFAFLNKSRYNLVIKSSATGYVLLVCFLFAAIASFLNVNIIFGAFLAGIVVGMASDEQVSKVKVHIREMGMGFFVPIYFAIVGLKLDLINHLDIMFFLGFLVFAVIVKMLGTMIAAKLARLDTFSSFNFAVAMNTRGGPGIVLATVAFDLGIINEGFFSVLVLTAVVTSLAAGYWFRYVLGKGWGLLKGAA